MPRRASAFAGSPVPPPRTVGTLPDSAAAALGLRRLRHCRLRAFGGGNQLQKFLRIVQPLLEFWPETLRRNLGGDGHVAGGRVGGNKFHFINSDRCLFTIAKAVLDLFGDILRLGTAEEKARTRRRTRRW